MLSKFLNNFPDALLIQNVILQEKRLTWYVSIGCEIECRIQVVARILSKTEGLKTCFLILDRT